MTAVRVAVLAALLVAAGCGGGDGGDSDFVFTSPDGDYTVSFDEEPNVQDANAPLPDGSTIPIQIYTDDDDGTVYAVNSIDYGAGTEVSLEGARDGAIANTPGAVLVESTDIELDGRPGIEYTADVNSGQGDVLARIYADGTRLYQLLVAGADVSLDDEQVQQFFASFRFTGAG
ncbi:MAG: hypothetical protein ACRDZ2_03580 [Ilumatobacteraceae bacterium]